MSEGLPYTGSGIYFYRFQGMFSKVPITNRPGCGAGALQSLASTWKLCRFILTAAPVPPPLILSRDKGPRWVLRHVSERSILSVVAGLMQWSNAPSSHVLISRSPSAFRTTGRSLGNGKDRVNLLAKSTWTSVNLMLLE